MQNGIARVPGRARRNLRSPYGLPAIPAREGWKPVTWIKENRIRKSYLPDPYQSPTGQSNRRSPAKVIDVEQEYYRQTVRRKMNAYHLHVQLGCIAQGLLQHLSLNFGKQVWNQFHGWLRTMDPTRPPSELVTSQALRERLPEFLDVLAQGPKARKMLRQLRRPLRRRNRRIAA